MADVRDMEENRRKEIWEINEKIGVYKRTIGRILHEDLYLPKVSAGWVLYNLSDYYNSFRLICFSENLDFEKHKYIFDIC